jgi:copper resistance protein C
MTRPRRAGARALVSMLAAMSAAVAAAHAHAVLVRSVPAARAVVAQAPERVDLWFNERLEPAFSTVSVKDAAGAQVDRRDGRVSPDDGTRLSASLPRLPAGSYSVHYRALSVDGHLVDASFPFSVRGEPR